MFQKATKKAAWGRIALIGPSGSGKTYTALSIAPALGSKIALIDTENGSASKYADIFEFDTMNLQRFSPADYIAGINGAVAAGYQVCIIDSLSHAWMGQGGVLEQVDKAAVKYKGNSFAAWRDATPQHNALIDALVRSPIHIIVTMRSKTAYEIQDDRGKKKPVKIGLAPVQREGLEYEFDIVGELDQDNNLVVGKTRCSALRGFVGQYPGLEFGQIIADWLRGNEPMIEEKQHRHLEAKISELGLDRSRVKSWALKALHVEHLNVMSVAQFEKLMAKLPEFAKLMQQERKPESKQIECPACGGNALGEFDDSAQMDVYICDKCSRAFNSDGTELGNVE